MVHTGAEIVGRDIKIVIDKRGCARLRLGIEEVLGGVDPIVKNGEVRAHDAGVARDELVLMAERYGGDSLIEHAAAYEVIVPVGAEGGKRGLVMRGDPAETQTGKREHLGHAADGNALFVQVGDGFAPDILLREVAVDLVAQEVCVHAAGDPDDLLQKLPAHERAGGVIGVVDADHLRVRGDKGAQLVKVDKVAVLLLKVHDGKVSADGLGDRIKLLIGRHDADDAVALGDEGAEHMVVRARRAVGGDDVLGLHGLIQAADAVEEIRAAVYIAVGQAPRAELAQEGFLILPGQLEQLVERHRVNAGLGDVVLCADLVLVHPFLYRKGLDLHWGFPP